MQAMDRPAGGQLLDRRVLLVEEDAAYRVVMRACVQIVGCEVDEVPTLALAFPVLDRRWVDLVLWGAPDGEPEASRRQQVIGEISLRTSAPIVLVAREVELAHAYLEAGATQFVPKPFVPGVLVGSISAALRATSVAPVPREAHLEVDSMILDGRTRTLSVHDRQVALTRQEWELLFILASNPNRFLQGREILRLGWHPGGHGPEQLRTYVHRLREKMAQLDASCTLESQHGSGYRLTAGEAQG